MVTSGSAAACTGLTVSVTGSPLARPVEDNPFLFLGSLGYWNEPNLGSVGLTYVRARWLDTGTGQWLSVDPVDGEPRYSYAYQSPTLFTDPSGQFAIPTALDIVGWALPSQAKKAFAQFQNRLLRNGQRAVDEVNTVIRELYSLQEQANAKWENTRRHLPKILTNIAPPPPGTLAFGGWELGMLWGTVQALFGLIPGIGVIPDIIAFIKYMVATTPKEGFFASIGDYIKEQWNGMISLFTKDLNMTPFQRGELFGSLMVAAVVAIIGVILAVFTAGVSLAAVFEAEGQDFIKVAKRLARAGAKAARNAPRNAAKGLVHEVRTKVQTGVAHAREVVQAVGEKRLPSGAQKHIDTLTLLKKQGKLKPEDLQAQATKYIRKLATGHKLGEDSASLSPAELADAIHIGTLKYKQHPNYAALKAKLESRGFIIEEHAQGSTVPAAAVRKNLDGSISRVVVTVKEMQYLDLEHEFDHVLHVTRLLELSHFPPF